MSYIAVVLVLGLLILVHEAGHFVAARCVGLPVRRFSVGFGPAILSRTRGGTEYRLSAVPLGGYVLLDVDDLDCMYRISLTRRLVFVMGGPAANVLLLVPMFALVNAFTIGPSVHALLLAPPAQALEMLLRVLAAIPALLDRPDAISGVVGIIAAGGQFVSAGVARLFEFAAILSANLAILNLLPLPPLDGGRALLDIVQRIVPRARRVVVPALLAGWLVIFGIMVYATVLDISRVAVATA